MKKWYVLSGNLRMIVMAESPFAACVAAMDPAHCHNGITLSQFFWIDERGFRDVTLGTFGPAEHHVRTSDVFEAMDCGF